MERLLIEKIEALRVQMVEEAFAQGSLTHEKVIALSEQLDKHIVLLQKLMLTVQSRPKDYVYSYVMGY